MLCIGLSTGLAVWEATAFFTSHRWAPTRSVAASGATGAATHLIQGLGVRRAPVRARLRALVCRGLRVCPCVGRAARGRVVRRIQGLGM